MSRSDEHSGKTKTPTYWAAVASIVCSVVRVFIDFIR